MCMKYVTGMLTEAPLCKQETRQKKPLLLQGWIARKLIHALIYTVCVWEQTNFLKILSARLFYTALRSSIHCEIKLGEPLSTNSVLRSWPTVPPNTTLVIQILPHNIYHQCLLCFPGWISLAHLGTYHVVLETPLYPK